jgi:hypothetical protein
MTLLVTFLKRWNSEFIDFYKNGIHNIQVSLEINELKVIIVNENKGYYKFILSCKYPFYQPRVFIKNEPYINILKHNKIPRIKNILYKYNIKCICCHTIINDINWSPAYRIKDIISEIKDVNNIKKYIKYYLIIDDICRKKNVCTDTIGIHILNFVIINNLYKSRFFIHM